MQRIILSMIVKNEAHVIERCLASVRPMITHWCIVDTGSTDGTQDVIRAALADLPGELHERPWKDFGHNRSEAIELARAQIGDVVQDYFFMIDADETLALVDGWQRPELTEVCYRLKVEFSGTWYGRNCLVAARKPWRYIGVLHEYIHCGEKLPLTPFDGAHVFVRPDGARSQQPKRVKYLADAAVLEQGLVDEPNNERYMFYLGNSYRSAGEWAKARDAYAQRVAMPSAWPEETWYAQYQLARMNLILELEETREPNDDETRGASATFVISSFMQAIEMRPHRAESMLDLAMYFRSRKAYANALAYAEAAARLPYPEHETIFVRRDYYDWRCRDELALLCYYQRPHRARGLALMHELLGDERVPAIVHARIQENLDKAAASAARQVQSLQAAAA